MATPQEVKMDRTGSHHVSDEYARGGYREQVFGYFTATWLGEPVIVTMQADRYTHSSGLSDWRIYAEQARSFDPEANGGRGPELTDTARRRLSDACKPLMVAWLEGDEYAPSLADAVRNMIVREMKDRHTSTAPRLLETYGDRLTATQREAIAAALAKRDEYHAALEIAGNA